MFNSKVERLAFGRVTPVAPNATRRTLLTAAGAAMIAQPAFAQTKFPAASNLEMKISAEPAEVKLNVPAPGSKSTVPENQPVV